MARVSITALVALLIGAAAGGAGVWKYLGPRAAEATRQERRLTLLSEENGRLRAVVGEQEKKKSLAANTAQREAIEREVAVIRGLDFKLPVAYNVLNRQEIKQTIAGKLAETFSEQEFKDMTAGLAAIGLLEPGFPLREKYIDLLGEQVAAFYDQHAHKLFMYEDATLDNAQNRVVLAHELTHALQDQHFSLNRMPLEIKNNDDRAVAASALVEGDATLVMSEFMLKNLSLRTLKDTVVTSFGQDMKQIEKAPRYLREMLVFPYLRGQEFCAMLFARGGYEAVSKAYQQPPSSSAQILHPEKFYAEPREEPIAVTWSDLEVNGQRPIADNVVGEFGVRVLFADWLDAAAAETVATGWRGDRYLAYDGGQGLVWKTVWANATEAAEFLEAEKQMLEKRHKLVNGRSGAGRYDSESPRVVRLRQTPANEVIVIDAATAPWANALATHFQIQ
jgi:hypothetical protein